MQIDHVLTKADQHLIGSLSGDAAVQPGLAGEKLRIVPAPQFRNLITEKHDPVFARTRGRQFRVVAAIANQAAPIAHGSILRRELAFEGLYTVGTGLLAPEHAGGPQNSQNAFPYRHAASVTASVCRSSTGCYRTCRCRRARWRPKGRSSGSRTRSDRRSTKALCR